MKKPTLGIIGGGQLGSLLADAAKKLEINTKILSDDPDAPGKNFATEFIFGQYDNEDTINTFLQNVDVVTYEFENIPYENLYYGEECINFYIPGNNIKHCTYYATCKCSGLNLRI